MAGRAIGVPGVAQWVSRRSCRSVRQLGARDVIGVLVLRLSSVASAGAVHLLCGAGRVPFTACMAGTIIAMTPPLVALSALGGVFRDALLAPSMANALSTITLAVLLIVLAGAIRTLLLIRQFAPSVCTGTARSSGDDIAAAEPSRRHLQRPRACVGTDGRHDPDRVASVVAELKPTSSRCRNSPTPPASRSNPACR